MIAIISKKKLVIFSTMKGPSFLLLIRFLFQLFIIKIINKVYMCNNETLSVEFVWIKASLFCVHYFKELKMQPLVCKILFLLVIVFLLLSQCFTPALSKHDRHLELSKVNSTVDEEYIDQCRRQPWAVLKDNTSCECGDNIDGIVRCDHDQNGALLTLMLPCFCMTYSDIYNRTLIGHCIYRCDFLNSSQYFIVEPLKGNESEYFGSGCIQNNGKLVRRTGQNCGNCLPGYAPALYTYNTSCVECSDYKYNWLKYLVIAYLPLTLFYIFIVLFRIKITSGVFNAYIITSQLLTAPVQMRLLTIGD